MLLSDETINSFCEGLDLNVALVWPYDDARLQPASYDVSLGANFVDMNPTRGRTITTSDGFILERSYGFDYELSELTIYPDEFWLGHTEETIALPADLAARFEGKSSLGRLGLLTHVTAGFIDPGFVGQITVELKNISSFPITLRVSEPIGQVCFYQLDSPSFRPYGSASLGSHYQGQAGATRSALETR